MHAPAPVYDLSRWWCDTWQKVQQDAQPPVYRYYRLCLRQDLWGQWELIRCWGRIGQKASREVREIIASPEAAEALRVQVQKTRRQHRYLPVAAPWAALDLADIIPGSEPPACATAEHPDAEITRSVDEGGWTLLG